jgi:hypothetical protein
MGVFAANGQSRTFDFNGGDVGYAPFAMGHYVEKTGASPLRFLEVFKSSRYADLSLNQCGLDAARSAEGAPEPGSGVRRRAAQDQGADCSGVTRRSAHMAAPALSTTSLTQHAAALAQR